MKSKDPPVHHFSVHTEMILVTDAGPLSMAEDLEKQASLLFGSCPSGPLP